MHPNDGRVVSNFIVQALKNEPITIYGDGSQTRSFCYVDDLIEGIYRLLLSDENRPVNIGNPTELTILELAEAVNKLVDHPVEIIFLPGMRGEGDPQRRRPDINRAREVLDWEPAVQLEEGLRRTLPYYRDQL